jgi:hypothetical protein
MVPTKQCESGTRNGVRKAFGRTPCTLVTRGCAAGLIKVDELAIDSSRAPYLQRKGGTGGTLRRSQQED